jgi:hypothetical protein
MPRTQPPGGAAPRLGSRVRATSRQQAAHHVEDAAERLHGAAWSGADPGARPLGVKLTSILCSWRRSSAWAKATRTRRSGSAPAAWWVAARPVLLAFRPHDQLVARRSLGLRAARLSCS